MARRVSVVHRLCLAVLCLVGGLCPATLSAAEALPDAEAAKLARQVFEAAGFRGGLVVHVGCGDGRLTAALRAGAGYLVHGLDADLAKVEKARQYLRSLGVYGGVAVEHWSGPRLPFVDNLVNLVVLSGPSSVDRSELLRVLCPGGAALTLNANHPPQTGDVLVKPRPADIDEWTHFLHSASNNAVAADSVVGPPRQLQWVAGPRWARSHDHLASTSALVCAGGRLFSIVDEGPIAAVALKPTWRLVARDAFSGVVLWQRPIESWPWHLRGFRSGPSDLARRLVAVGDRVYVTLGLAAPLSALEAATGRTVRTYEGTGGTLEVICHEGVLLVVAGDPAAMEAAAKAQRRGERPGLVEARPQRPPYPENPPAKRILAIQADTGRLLWSKADAETAELMPTTLAAGGGRVFFQNADAVVCLDGATGAVKWRAARPVSRHRPTWSAPTLVVYGDVVLSADRAVAATVAEAAKPNAPALPKVEWLVTSAGGQSPPGELIAFSADDGQRLWSCGCRECYNAPVDVLVADGLVWTGDIVTAKDPGVTEGRDPRTGEVKRTRPNDQQFFTPGMGHQRCYRNKATSKYLVFGRSGVEFIELATGKAIPHHWTRGVCQYGVVPCNGLLYVPHHSCACFVTAKLDGFNCFAPQRAEGRGTGDAGRGARLQRGPAFGSEMAGDDQGKPSAATAADWPTYRRDPARSGRSPAAVPAQIHCAWQTDLGGKLSSLVAAEGKLLVAQVDAHTVHALDAAEGRHLWSYTAGGRVDSPPTLWRGRALFGAADGWVYCLRAADGALAWRFRAAPEDMRIVSYGQVESAWPVPGNVLVKDGVAYCVAGRSSYLDGGLRLCRLDAETGRLLSETVIDHRDPATGYQSNEAVRGTDMPGALPDVLACDGTSIYLRHLRFDLSGAAQPADEPHLFSPAGFLDDSWWHRTYWLVGTAMGTNYGGWPVVGSRVPAGRLLVLDDSWVYGFGRNQYSHTGSHIGIDSETVFHYHPDRYNPRQTYYQAFSIAHDAGLGRPAVTPPAKPKTDSSAKAQVEPKAKSPGKPKPKATRAAPPPPKNYRWTRPLPIMARSMVLAGENLFVAGPPDVLASDDPAGAWEGRRGGRLVVLSAAEGNPLAEHALDSPPVFDGMIAAGQRLYLATMDGKVLAFAGSE